MNADPAKKLITDVSLGDTISLQTFKTQFVFDLAVSLDISPCQLYVTDVSPGEVYHTWNSKSLILSFTLFPADGNLVRELTRQVQHPDSNLYEKGLVTKATDERYGLVCMRWDVTLKLEYSMSVINGKMLAGDENKDENEEYLNTGSSRFCLENGMGKYDWTETDSG